MTARHSMEEQIEEVLNTSLFKSGESFALYQMLHLCTKVTHLSRMSEVLREMKARGLANSHGIDRTEVYFRYSGALLKKKWVSDEAQRLCESDYAGILTGQAARDVVYSSGRMARPC